MVGLKNKIVLMSLRMFFLQVNCAECGDHAPQEVRQPGHASVAFRCFAKHARWAFFVCLLLCPGLASAQGSAAQTAESDNATDQTTIFPNSDTSRWWITAHANVVFQWHRAFPAEYSGANSLTSQAQSATTDIFALYTGFFGWGRVAFATRPDPTTGATSTAGPEVSAIPATQSTSSATEKGASGPDQLWNFHVQNTEIVQGYPPFRPIFWAEKSAQRR